DYYCCSYRSGNTFLF
nr:immunoglobulin light chain junction region [Macaca mulatta]MOV97314.1 immunoglobulin light chain junction region [Macaca mulatta]MOV97849.1 immunoglobulin light chain junction region [Macaca mulatta]MOV98531.1 immunoglobulin light chain junction region [Macaca mulatta]MOV99080.1 immunoglobulin light chain junction region [Macaca mulatta]